MSKQCEEDVWESIYANGNWEWDSKTEQLKFIRYSNTPIHVIHENVP